MMLKVRNLTSAAIGGSIVGGSGISPDAFGGSKFKPLPYPFAHVTLAANTGGGEGADTVSLPIHVGDFQYKSVPWLPLAPSAEWQDLVQKGVIALTFYKADAAEGVASVEDTAFLTNVP